MKTVEEMNRRLISKGTANKTIYSLLILGAGPLASTGKRVDNNL